MTALGSRGLGDATESRGYLGVDTMDGGSSRRRCGGNGPDRADELGEPLNVWEGVP